MASTSSNDAFGAPKAKRARLSLACNECRKRKVKCDAEMPQCRNCRIRGKECITTDPRNPALVVYRQAQSGTVHPLQFQGPLSEAAFFNSGSTDVSSNPHGSQQDAALPTAAQHHDTARERSAFNNEHQGPEAINRDGQRHRRKLVGQSSLQSLSMILDMCFEKFGLPCFAPSFKHGMRHVEEFQGPLQFEVINFPPTPLLESLLALYNERIHPMLPVIDVAHISTKIQYFQGLGEERSGLDHGLLDRIERLEIPFLACSYALISIGADEMHGGTSELGTRYLNAAYSLYAHLVSMPYVASAQAFLLMAINLRGRSKEGQASLMVAQAIRIAQSIGMHRSAARSGTETPNPPGKAADDLHVRIWWSLFALEKIFEIETTRPSPAHQIDCDQILPTVDNSSFPCFVHFVSLACVMGQVSATLYRAKRGQGTAAQYLQNVLKLDEGLSSWLNGLPEHIRPGHLFCDDSEKHIGMFLSHQYYQTLITVHRAALVVPPQEYHREFEQLKDTTHTTSTSWLKIKKGADICVQSAKGIITVDEEIADNRMFSLLLTVTPSYLACVVLALQIIRQPHSRTAKSNLELLSNEMHHVAELYKAVGQDERLIEGCEVLRRSIATFLGMTSKPQQDQQSNIISNQMLTPGSILSATESGQTELQPELVMETFDALQDVAFADFWMTLDPLSVYPNYINDSFEV